MSEASSSGAQPQPHLTLRSLVEDKRILVTVGSGGVGKTTTAASLGLAAARLGRKTLVMTIDPARRLATSLGLEQLDNEEREVPEHKLSAAGLAAGNLYAIMLDQKGTFDDLIRRYAPDQATIDKLMQSRIYQQLSARLAGSQEYAAMEKLHAIWKGGRYQLLLLDTPPTANALDFLEAPAKMVEAVESPAVRLFVSTYQKAGRMSLNVLGFGAAYVIRRIARFTGGDFLDDIAAFLSDLSGLLTGIGERAGEVMALLAQPDVGFIIVTSPDPRSVDEAISFYDQLQRSKLAPVAVVINMVHPLQPSALERPEVADAIAQGLSLPRGEAEEAAPHLIQAHARLQSLARADAEQIERLKAHCGHELPYVEVPFFDEDIYDVRGLTRVSSSLMPTLDQSEAAPATG